jgi:serine/threonine protein kinase
LFQGVAFGLLEKLQQEQERAFAELTEALSRQSQRLEELLVSLDDKIDRLERQIEELLKRLKLEDRPVRPSDSLSIRDDGERALVKQLVTAYRALPAEQRRLLPTLLNKVGTMENAAGELDSAQEDFTDAAVLFENPKAKAEAYHNAYRAALDRQQWAEALDALRQAMFLDSEQFAPFPTATYFPQRILGAGGFGVVFLCQHPHLNRSVVVKSLLATELDRDVNAVFGEAQALEDLQHPGIIRVRDCGYADQTRKRPFVVMDYFEGVNLGDYVATNGPLSPVDLLPVARLIAEALQAAHQAGIIHRDVKPANVLVRREPSGWKVKLIDFGLAMRPSTLGAKVSTQGPQAKTTLGRSIAGTVHYAAPEQMGRLPVPVGAPSDIYGFGKTCYYALFKTPDPDDDDKEGLPEGWRQFLRRCTRNDPANRFQDFAALLAGLAGLVLTRTSVAVVSSPNPAVYGQGVTLTARVDAASPAGSLPTGTVSLKAGDTVLGSVPLNGGAASLTTSALPAGSHAIVVSYGGDANFRASSSAPLTQTVTPAPLTVTARDASKTAGEANPAFVATFSGFANGEGESSLGGPLSFTTSATEESQAGSYSVSPGGLTSNNYSITFVPGTLTVTGPDDWRSPPVKKDGLTQPQVRILTFLARSASEGPQTRKQIAEGAPCDLPMLNTYIGPVNEGLRTQPQFSQSLLVLGYVQPAVGEGRGSAYCITEAGRKALVSIIGPGAALIGTMFNDLLRKAGFNPSAVRYIRHKDTSAEKGRTPYELWRDNRPQFEAYQSDQNPNNRKRLNAPFWAVFIANMSNKNMFAGVYAVKYQGLSKEDRPRPQMDGISTAGTADMYELALQPALSEYIGKLFIDWGQGALAWIQKAENQDKTITEVRSEFVDE